MSRVVPAPSLVPPPDARASAQRLPPMRRPDPRPPCPDCGADDVLVLHASYRPRPPRALRWLTCVFPAHLTLVYACTACHHLIWINTLRPRSRTLLPSAAPRARAPATTPSRPLTGHTSTRTSVLQGGLAHRDGERPWTARAWRVPNGL